MVTPSHQAQLAARVEMTLRIDALAEAILAYGRATKQRFEEEGVLPPDGDTWRDLDRFGKWRG